MANFYTVSAIGATFRPYKHMLTLFNGTGSGKILKIWKIWVLNNQSTAISGIMSELRLVRISATGGGAALSISKYNSSLSALPSQIVAAEGAINTVETSIFKRLNWSTEEPVATSSNLNVWELNPNWTTFWEVKPTQTTIEPLTLNTGQGVSIYFNTNSSVGLADFFIEFTAV